MSRGTNPKVTRDLVKFPPKRSSRESKSITIKLSSLPTQNPQKKVQQECPQFENNSNKKDMISQKKKKIIIVI